MLVSLPLLSPDPVWPPPATRAGWIRLDCHLHTAASGDARTTLEEVAERVEAVHLDVVCITDHHAIDAAQTLQRELGIRVVVGEEIRTPSGEIIGLFLSERIPYVLPVPQVIHRIKAQGGLVYAPHPFDPERAGLRKAVLEALVTAGELDIIEVFNAKIPDPVHNLAAIDFAKQFDVAPGVGSDAHDPEGIGAAYIEVPDFDGPSDMLRALREGRVVGQYRPHAPRYATRQSAEPTARDGTPYSQGTTGWTSRA